MNYALNEIVLFIGFVLILSGLALYDETRPPTEADYKQKEMEFWRWLHK